MRSFAALGCSQNTSFNFNTPFVLTYNNGRATPSAHISNPLLSGSQLPPGSSQGLFTGLGLSISGPIRTWNNTPYVQTRNFGLERELKGNILIDANYVGTKGTPLYSGLCHSGARHSRQRSSRDIDCPCSRHGHYRVIVIQTVFFGSTAGRIFAGISRRGI